MSWTTVKLGEVITHRKEFITISDTVEYKRCRVQVNRKGVVLRDSVKGIQINTKKQQVCKEGDFLVAEIDAKVGGYGFVPADLDGAIVSSHYFLFEVDETKMLKSYLAWIIKTDIIQEQISSKGSTNYAAIRPSHVLNFEIPLPPLTEQNELIKKLDSFYQEYELIQEELLKQENYLTLLRQSILQEAVQGKLVPQDANDEPAEKLLQRIKAEKAQLIKEGKLKREKEQPTIKEEEVPFELPKGWVWCRLGDMITDFLSGYAFKSSDFRVSGESQVLRLGNVKNNKLLMNANPVFINAKIANDAISSQLHPGDILITMTGTRLKRDYCYTVLLHEQNFQNRRLFLNQRVGCLRFNNILSLEFVNAALKANLILDSIFKEETGTANQGNVGVATIKSTPFPLPPLSEQQRIINKVEDLIQLLIRLETQLQQSKSQAEQLLQAVLKEAFTAPEEMQAIARPLKKYKENEELTMAAEE